MNKKKVFVVIAVLLVALVSTSSIIYAAQEGNVKSDLTAAQSGNETQQEEAGDKPVKYMFVQSAHSGSFVPVEGEMNYTLTLEGVAPQTIAFSDRPERVVDQVPMQKFLDRFDFSAENPPNAAIDILEGNESQDVIVVELFEPVYDATNRTLQYNVSIMEEPNHSYAIFNERHDESLPEHFGPAALFIDDCSDCILYCETTSGRNCGRIHIGRCWQTFRFPPGCYPCFSDSHYRNLCKKHFGADCNFPNYKACGEPS